MLTLYVIMLYNIVGDCMGNTFVNLINDFDVVDNIEVIIVGEETCKPSHFEGPTVRTDYLFHYVVSGKGKVVINGKEYKLSSGNGFLITYKDYIYYEADEKDPWHYIWIIITGSGAEKFFNKCGINEEQPIYFSSNVEKTSREALLLIEKTLKSNNSYSFYGAIYDFWGVMSECSENLNCPDISEAKRYVIAAKRFVAVNFYKKITVRDICKSLGIERTYLFRLFKEYEKVSPQEYIINYKMNYARELLKRGDLKVNQVALSVGYNDQCAFSKIFTKHFGKNPKEYIIGR